MTPRVACYKLAPVVQMEKTVGQSGKPQRGQDS